MNYLRLALVVFGVINIGGLYLMMTLWPPGWVWTPSQPQYEQMIVGVYATLGVFLILAARAPLKHLSLIWFTIWSSVVHAGIMSVQAFMAGTESAHFLGDIPALFLMAIVFWALIPKDAEQINSRYP